MRFGHLPRAGGRRPPLQVPPKTPLSACRGDLWSPAGSFAGISLANQNGQLICVLGICPGHTIEGIIYKNHGDFLSPGRSMNDFRHTYGGQIPITLIGK
jgi:hypothetical protein